MEKQVYRGRCQGGPMRSQVGESRFPKGFVLVDRPRNMATVYDWDGEVFIARESEELDTEKRWKAADSTGWDVRSV